MATVKSKQTLDEAEEAVQNNRDGTGPSDQPQTISKNFLSPTKRLVVLLTGSFNPVTIAHLRMLELARDYYHLQSIQVVEGILSPVSDSYGKAGLVPVNYRIEMLQAAIRNDHWMRIDTWEAEQTSWTRTKIVLDHHQEEIKKKFGEDVELRLLSGADVVRSMLNAKVWLPKDIDDIMTKYGVACITRLSAAEPARDGATLPDVKEGMPDLWKPHVEVIEDWLVNNISSTIIRDKLGKGFSIKYIVPDGTIGVIRQYGLYNCKKTICLAEWPYEEKQK